MKPDWGAFKHSNFTHSFSAHRTLIRQLLLGADSQLVTWQKKSEESDRSGSFCLVASPVTLSVSLHFRVLLLKRISSAWINTLDAFKSFLKTLLVLLSSVTWLQRFWKQLVRVQAQNTSREKVTISHVDIARKNTKTHFLQRTALNKAVKLETSFYPTLLQFETCILPCFRAQSAVLHQGEVCYSFLCEITNSRYLWDCNRGGCDDPADKRAGV